MLLSRVFTGRSWPFAEGHDFPKADTRAAGFGKSRRTIPAASFGCEVDILSGKNWPLLRAETEKFRAATGRLSAMVKAQDVNRRRWTDDNLTKNGIRPFIVSRKNFLPGNSADGAKARANTNNMLETAGANGSETNQYLKWVFNQLPQAMKRVVLIGLEPTNINFSDPDYAAFAHLDAKKVQAGLDQDVVKLNAHGYEAELCLTDSDPASAAAIVMDRLKQTRYDCVLIGAGVRSIPKNFLLFEMLINVVHEHASEAGICFNSRPDDSAEAVKRWI